MKEEVITEEVILETPSIPGDVFHLKIFGSIHVHDCFLQSSLLWDNKKGANSWKEKSVWTVWNLIRKDKPLQLKTGRLLRF